MDESHGETNLINKSKDAKILATRKANFITSHPKGHQRNK